MKIAMIGLGKMGANMTTRLIGRGHDVVVYDLNPEAMRKAESEGAIAAFRLEEVVNKLETPRAVWLMLPAGKPTEITINKLANLLSPNDTIIDGGNSYYKDTIRRGQALAKKEINYVDVGTSGGVWGLKEGYSMMIGGKTEAVKQLEPIFKSLAPASDKGWGHVGPSGSGHFVKMVHNGIEYGMMQAYAEGFDLMHKKEEFGLDMQQIANIWQDGSVVRSWLLDLTANAMSENPEFDGIASWVPDSGEGRWTVLEAIETATPMPVISMALQSRFASRDENAYSFKLLSALRNQFGGHAIKKD